MNPDASGPAAVPAWGETKIIGKRLPRIDGYERVTGQAIFTADVFFPNMLHAAVLRCPYAHARVKRLDTARAEKMPGVHAVIGSSTPGGNIPWFAGRKGPTSHIFDTHCRYAGEEVAAVAADTPYQAADALRAITVEYEPLPFVVDGDDALKPGAPLVQDGGNTIGPTAVMNRGDVAKGFAEADVVIEETYHTSCEIHAPLEAHAAVARWDADQLTVWNTVQGVFNQQTALATAFRLPLSSVRVICSYVGGGFGGKLEAGKHSVIAALLARVTQQPVKLVLRREDLFLCVGNRPARTMSLKAGVKKDGTLTALHMVNHGVVGAYPYLGGAVGAQVMDLYSCPNARAEDTDIHINAGKASAMRAPGAPACAWALEQMMDALAVRIHIDPVEFRLKNIPTVSQLNQKPYTSTGLKQCLEDGAEAFGWKAAREAPRAEGHIRRGVGVAAAIWSSPGEPNSTIILKLNSDGSANLNMGASDIGTGTKTVMAMVVAEELGVPMAKIHIEYSDTGTTQYAPMSGGSQTVVANTPAVRAAALEARRQLLEIAAEELKLPASELSVGAGKVFPTSAPDKAVPFSDLKTFVRRRVIVAVGTRQPHPARKVPLPFAAQFAEVEVNTRTGEVKVLRIVAAHDSGRVMNRLTYDNQVFGGVTKGIGLALTEQRRIDRQTGRVLNANLSDYRVPTALEMPPQMTCVAVDPHDTECNTTGTKGLGEPATIPTAAAIANAVYHAIGVRATAAPITRGSLLGLLAKSRSER